MTHHTHTIDHRALAFAWELWDLAIAELPAEGILASLKEG